MKKLIIVFSALAYLLVFSCQKESTTSTTQKENPLLLREIITNSELSNCQTSHTGICCCWYCNVPVNSKVCGLDAGTTGTCPCGGTGKVTTVNQGYQTGESYDANKKYLIENISETTGNYRIYYNSNWGEGECYQAYIDFTLSPGEIAQISFNAICIPTVTDNYECPEEE